jgi:hypothetical protein
MPESPLYSEATVTAVGGIGSVSLGPGVPGERWDLSSVAVSCTGVAIPTCKVYMNNVLVDGTFTGNLDSTGRVEGTPLSIGQKVRADWTGADATAKLTLSVTGTKRW